MATYHMEFIFEVEPEEGETIWEAVLREYGDDECFLELGTNEKIGPPDNTWTE